MRKLIWSILVKSLFSLSPFDTQSRDFPKELTIIAPTNNRCNEKRLVTILNGGARMSDPIIVPPL